MIHSLYPGYGLIRKPLNESMILVRETKSKQNLQNYETKLFTFSHSNYQ